MGAGLFKVKNNNNNNKNTFYDYILMIDYT